MLDPFIGLCKEGKLTVEHTLPYFGVQQVLTSVNILLISFFCQLKENLSLTFLVVTSQFPWSLFQRRRIEMKDAEEGREDRLKHELGSGLRG